MNRLQRFPRLVAVLLWVLNTPDAAAQSDFHAKSAMIEGLSAYRSGSPEADSLLALGTVHSELGALAEYNLGRSLVQTGDTARAQAAFRKAIGSTDDAGLRSSAWHNLGNLHLQKSELEPAISSYKQALRENPANEEARYNLTYAMRLLQQQQDQQQQQQDQQDQQQQQQDQQQDQQENSDQGNEERQGQPENEPGEGEGENEDDREGEGEQESEQRENEQDGEPGNENPEQPNAMPQEPVEGQISPEDMERILESLERNESAIQAKLQRQLNGGERRTIEKDW